MSQSSAIESDLTPDQIISRFTDCYCQKKLNVLPCGEKKHVGPPKLPFRYFKVHGKLDTEIIGGWKCEEDRIYPTPEASFEGLCDILDKYLKRGVGFKAESVFVEKSNYFLLFQTGFENPKCFRIPKSMMSKIPDKVCAGCHTLPWSTNDSNMTNWCTFSHMISNYQA